MKTISLLLLLSLLFPSCSKESSETKTDHSDTSAVVSKHKNMKEQEAPPREIVDAENEGYSVDQVIKINKDIPVLELICAKNWTQSDLHKVSSLKELDTLRIENTDTSDFNLSFCKEMQALKKVSLKGSKISVASLKSLIGCTITSLDLSGTDLNETDKAALTTLLKDIKIHF